MYYPHFPQQGDDDNIALRANITCQSSEHHAEPHLQITCTAAVEALRVAPGSEFLSEKQHWHVAALLGPPDTQPRLRTEERTASQSRGCTETQKTDDGHCCTQPTETQSTER